jgi:hypothetical protein
MNGKRVQLPPGKEVTVLNHRLLQVHKLKSVPDIENELRGRQKMGRESTAYDSDDDDDMPRGQRVQCAQS